MQSHDTYNSEFDILQFDYSVIVSYDVNFHIKIFKNVLSKSFLNSSKLKSYKELIMIMKLCIIYKSTKNFFIETSKYYMYVLQ